MSRGKFVFIVRFGGLHSPKDLDPSSTVVSHSLAFREWAPAPRLSVALSKCLSPQAFEGEVPLE